MFYYTVNNDHILTVVLEVARPKTGKDPSPNVMCCYQNFLFTNECKSDGLKNNIKSYIKIAPTCSGAVKLPSGSALFVLAKVTLVKIANNCTSVCD